MVRVGLVGCGYIGQFHAAKLSKMSGVDFVGCMDIRPQRSQMLAARHGVRSYDDIDCMAREIDAVSVAVPTKSHFEVASRFLEAGVAVLLEKPITDDPESAEKLVSLARKRKAVFQIGHSERFNPAFMAIQNGVQRPNFIEIHRLASFKGRGDDVAVILDLMTHDIDLTLAMTGSLPEEIEAAGVAVVTSSVDIANARLTFPQGCIANITASRISSKEMRKLRVFQKSSYVSVDLAKRRAEQYLAVRKGSRGSNEGGVVGGIPLPDDRVVIRKELEIRAGDNLELEIASFIEAVQGKHPPVVSGEDGLNVLVVAGQIEKHCREFLTKI